MLEVPRAEEELATGDPGPSPKASSLDAELAMEEGNQDAPAKSRKAKDLLKGEYWVWATRRGCCWVTCLLETWCTSVKVFPCNNPTGCRIRKA